MIDNDHKLALFQAKIIQLLDRFQALEAENAGLRSKLDDCEARALQLKADYDQKCSDYEALKVSKVLSVSDDDIERTRARLTKMIRDVNKCIAVLKQ